MYTTDWDGVAVGGGEAAEDDPVTFEDVADEDDLQSEAAIAAASDDANLNDEVDATTVATTDDGSTYTNTGGSGDSAEWAELPDTGTETEETEGTATGSVDGTTASDSLADSEAVDHSTPATNDPTNESGSESTESAAQDAMGDPVAFVEENPVKAGGAALVLAALVLGGA